MVVQRVTNTGFTTAMSESGENVDAHSLLICLFGPFRLVNAHQKQLGNGSEKMEVLLSYLALFHSTLIPREQLLALLWPESDPVLAGQSLNTLVYTVRKLLKDELAGESPVVQVNGYYGLNRAAGVTVDVMQFEQFAAAGEKHERVGHEKLAAAAYHRAVEMYRGDLCMGTDSHALIERERLRSLYLTMLARLANYYYGQQGYTKCLAYVQRLLSFDPCREDAHRLAMRAYVRLGERAQAFRQYSLCHAVLQAELGVEPEPATVTLYDLICSDPTQV